MNSIVYDNRITLNLSNATDLSSASVLSSSNAAWCDYAIYQNGYDYWMQRRPTEGYTNAITNNLAIDWDRYPVTNIFDRVHVNGEVLGSDTISTVWRESQTEKPVTEKEIEPGDTTELDNFLNSIRIKE